MSIWILEMIFIVILTFNIMEASMLGSCIVMAVVNVIWNLFTGFSNVGFIPAIIYGIILGAVAYVAALICQAIIEETGIFGKILLVGALILIALAIIF